MELVLVLVGVVRGSVAGRDLGCAGDGNERPQSQGESKLSEEEALITRWGILPQYDLPWQSLFVER